MGRPAELNPELAERIVGYLRDGASLKDAAGPAATTRASSACGGATASSRAREPYVSFAAALTRARREGKLALVGHILTAAQHDWRAAAWLLERMHPAELAKRTIPPPSRRDASPSVELPEHTAEAAHEFLRRVRSNGGS